MLKYLGRIDKIKFNEEHKNDHILNFIKALVFLNLQTKLNKVR